eukprot:TRINITY_DN28869_c1_g1_i2.p1 TRINITY_DN28869_c1_g1~~TRINITY_DN28869_c1_g1_i2.p1  ORF type:complete len:133 (+),score=8.34 TRINITY_DN28869_c1_g1_i2:312-710(+)
MVAGCRKHGVRRLMFQACALSAVPGERWGLLTPARLSRNVVRWQLGSKTIDDSEKVINYLFKEVQDLDWTVSRPAWLEDGERKGSLAPNLDPFKPSTIRYLDLADWTLSQIDASTYVGKMPRLCYPPVSCPI